MKRWKRSNSGKIYWLILFGFIGIFIYASSVIFSARSRGESIVHAFKDQVSYIFVTVLGVGICWYTADYFKR